MTELSYDERDVLKTILRHGGDNLERNLLIWGEWIREADQAKFHPYSHQAQFPLVVLSLMGIHGREALT